MFVITVIGRFQIVIRSLDLISGALPMRWLEKESLFLPNIKRFGKNRFQNYWKAISE